MMSIRRCGTGGSRPIASQTTFPNFAGLAVSRITPTAVLFSTAVAHEGVFAVTPGFSLSEEAGNPLFLIASQAWYPIAP